MKKVLVFSGPSGSGKSTLIKHILQKYDGIVGTTVSCTTRSPRAGEVDGLDYHFLNHAEFLKNIENNAFIEHVECFGNRYGTLMSSVDDVFKTKELCILDIDFEGAYKVLMTDLLPYDCIGVLVLPPSISTLKQRIIDRNSETAESLNIRITESFNISRIANYKHIIINNELVKSKELAEQIIETVKNN